MWWVGSTDSFNTDVIPPPGMFRGWVGAAGTPQGEVRHWLVRPKAGPESLFQGVSADLGVLGGCVGWSVLHTLLVLSPGECVVGLGNFKVIFTLRTFFLWICKFLDFLL